MLPLDPIQRRQVLRSLTLSSLLLSACRRVPAERQVDLWVESDGDLLAFKPKELSCPSGAAVHLTFRHTGRYVSYDHNWVLILPHTFDAVTQAALAAGERNSWVPPNDKHVLAATPLCGRGQQATITFTAPPPGDYPFICSNPGHAEDMWGILHVTAT